MRSGQSLRRYAEEASTKRKDTMRTGRQRRDVHRMLGGTKKGRATRLQDNEDASDNDTRNSSACLQYLTPSHAGLHACTRAETNSEAYSGTPFGHINTLGAVARQYSSREDAFHNAFTLETMPPPFRGCSGVAQVFHGECCRGPSEPCALKRRVLLNAPAYGNGKRHILRA